MSVHISDQSVRASANGISVFDLFTVGLGPSSSHTVGPMRAAATFAETVARLFPVADIHRIDVDLYGSLAATGLGHGTQAAILIGLEGNRPDTVEPAYAHELARTIDVQHQLMFAGRAPVALSSADIRLHPFTRKPRHTNCMRFTAYGSEPGTIVYAAEYFSVGGGFIEGPYDVVMAATATGECATGSEISAAEGAAVDPTAAEVGVPMLPFPFATAVELVAMCSREGASIAQLMWQNECARRSPELVRSGLLTIWAAMEESINAGLTTTGTLPGVLQVRRRAADIYRTYRLREQDSTFSSAVDWLNISAMAVNEENAAGGRVVTAPTNGAAGIIPAVLSYALRYVPALREADAREQAIIDFLLTAGAIATLYKARASVSGAEVGCQGEVGSACSMAAGALAAVSGATPAQVENAAEIGMEHNLGLTCDPIAGLVQIPCIERNAVAAVKAVNAAQMALHGDGQHRVSLDQVIETMRQTGADMNDKYKETSRGGLAVNVPEC